MGTHRQSRGSAGLQSKAKAVLVWGQNHTLAFSSLRPSPLFFFVVLFFGCFVLHPSRPKRQHVTVTAAYLKM